MLQPSGKGAIYKEYDLDDLSKGEAYEGLVECLKEEMYYFFESKFLDQLQGSHVRSDEDKIAMRQWIIGAKGEYSQIIHQNVPFFEQVVYP